LSAWQEIVLGTSRHHCAAMNSSVRACRNRRQLHRSRRRCRQAQDRTLTRVLDELAAFGPDIQEALLFLPPMLRDRDPIILANLMPITACIDWRKQRRLWRQLLPS
jgi:hypothetical protein